MQRVKCLIASDTHGRTEGLAEALRRNPNVDAVIFLGDGLADAEAVADATDSQCLWLTVRGNCDLRGTFRGQSVKTTDTITLLDKRIVFTHGHEYEVKINNLGLRRLAEKTFADIVLYGHTHTPREEYENGVYYFNPGSLRGGYGGACCALMTIEQSGVLFSYLKFD